MRFLIAVSLAIAVPVQAQGAEFADPPREDDPGAFSVKLRPLRGPHLQDRKAAPDPDGHRQATEQGETVMELLYDTGTPFGGTGERALAAGAAAISQGHPR